MIRNLIWRLPISQQNDDDKSFLGWWESLRLAEDLWFWAWIGVFWAARRSWRARWWQMSQAWTLSVAYSSSPLSQGGEVQENGMFGWCLQDFCECKSGLSRTFSVKLLIYLQNFRKVSVFETGMICIAKSSDIFSFLLFHRILNLKDLYFPIIGTTDDEHFYIFVFLKSALNFFTSA